MHEVHRDSCDGAADSIGHYLACMPLRFMVSHFDESAPVDTVAKVPRLRSTQCARWHDERRWRVTGYAPSAAQVAHCRPTELCVSLVASCCASRRPLAIFGALLRALARFGHEPRPALAAPATPLQGRRRVAYSGTREPPHALRGSASPFCSVRAPTAFDQACAQPEWGSNGAHAVWRCSSCGETYLLWPRRGVPSPPAPLAVPRQRTSRRAPPCPEEVMPTRHGAQRGRRPPIARVAGATRATWGGSGVLGGQRWTVRSVGESPARGPKPGGAQHSSGLGLTRLEF